MFLPDMLRGLIARLGPIRRAPLARLAEGGAIGVALWCMFLVFGLLPGVTADDFGLAAMAFLGMAAGISRFDRFLRGALMFGAAIVVVVALTPLSSFIAQRWPRNDLVPASGVGAVVALSASVTADSSITYEGLDHVISGLELIRAHKADLLVTTRVRQHFPTGIVTSDSDQTRIIRVFGDGVRWMRTPIGHSTRDEATLSAALLMPRGVRRVAVVTSPMHTRRACATFEAVGFDVTCVAARIRGPGSRMISPWPRARLAAFGEWVYEVTAMAKYRGRGWIGGRLGSTQ